MKLFKCTVETYPNNCYVETLLIVANNEKDAENQIKDSRRDKYNKNPEIVYTGGLKEIKIDLNKKSILQVGHGSGDNDNDYDD
jgi:soluble cytochrome b562